jgi:signal transduction histidine kinase
MVQTPGSDESGTARATRRAVAAAHGKRAGSLRALVLKVEAAFLALVVVTAGIGAMWAHFWHDASAEAVRINALFSGAQALRGDVYRGLREVTRAQLQLDPTALDKYWRLLYGIDLSFNRLDQRAQHPDELAAIAGMREAYSKMQATMNRVFGESLQSTEGARVEMLDPAYERWILGDFEQSFQALAQTINARRSALENKLARFNQLAPALITVPILVGLVLLLLTRGRFRHGFVQPMETIRQAAARMRGGELDTRIAATGVSEMRELSRALNDMAEELARNRDTLVSQERQAAQGALVPVVAHNIRNPLASIRAAVQVADPTVEVQEWQAAQGEIIATVDRLERWVSSLLHYLHPLQPHAVRCKVRDLVQGALGPCRTKADAKGIELDDRLLDAALECDADVDLMEQALHGLIANAIDASPRGASVAITARVTGDGDVAIIVRDHGPGIPPQTEPRDLRPGPTTKRLGTGLGIPFAYKVLRGHGGQLRFERPAGGGTSAVVVLPPRQPAAAGAAPGEIADAGPVARDDGGGADRVAVSAATRSRPPAFASRPEDGDGHTGPAPAPAGPVGRDGSSPLGMTR